MKNPKHNYHHDLLDALSCSPSETGRYGLFLMYQAKVDLQSARVVGYEALLRWNHKRYGYISPETCLELAEGFDLSRALHMWTVHKACFDMYRYPTLQVAVNMCPRLLDMTMAREIMDILRDTGVAPMRLQLELTEHYAPEDMHDLAVTVAWLRRQGIQVALDDFGTGHATIAYLAKVDLDYVKIDKTLIQGIADSPLMRQEFLGLVDLISVTGAKIICEGVENHEDALFLKNMGMNQAQGYFFHKPAVIEDLIPFHTFMSVAG